MKNLFKLLVCLGLLVVPNIAAAIDIVPAGSTNSISQCVNIFIADVTAATGNNGLAGLTEATAGTCSYRRGDVAAPVNMTLVAGTVGTFTANSFVAVDNTDQKGVYQICLPNAAVATGVKEVVVTCLGATNALTATLRVLLDPSVNVASIDSLAIQEGDFAPTNLFGAGSTTTVLQLDAAETSNDITGQSLCATSGIASKTCRVITAYDTGTKEATVSPAFTNAPANGDGYSIGTVVSGSSGSCPTAAQNADAVWDELRAGHVIAGSFGQALQNIVSTAATIAATVWDSLRASHLVNGSFGQLLQAAHSGTAQAGGANTITLANTASAVNDYYKNQVVQVLTGTGAGQAAAIQSYVGATRVATLFSSWATNPNNTSGYIVYPAGAGGGGSGGGSPWDELRASHVAAGTFGEGVNVGPKGIKGLSFGDDVIGKVRTAQSVGTQQIKLAASEIYATNQLKNSHMILVTSAGVSGATSGTWEAHCICGNAGTTDLVTLCENWIVQPTGTVQYTILPFPGCAGNSSNTCH